MKKIYLPFMVLGLLACLAMVPRQQLRRLAGYPSVLTNAPGVPLLPIDPYNYTRITSLPFDSFGGSYDPVGNPLTDAGATLGRVLFYDTRLSENQTISCASCHLQQFGFSDTAQFSVGFDGELTERHSMGLTNARNQPLLTFFWDASEDTLKNQVEAALTSSIEMGMHLDTLVNRLAATDFYPALFEDAFGDRQITADRAAAAMGQFVRSMQSSNSKFDIAMFDAGFFAFFPFAPIAPPAFPHLTEAENRGMQLFFSEELTCGICHAAPHFTMFFPSDNGLDANPTDPGLGGITGNEWEMGRFKAPSLRNIALTPPYMHDGRFETLEEVVEHYNSGIQPSPNLEPLLQDQSGQPRRLNLSTQDKAALVAFLHTLTDPYFIDDPRWEDPFTISQVRAVPNTPLDTLLGITSNKDPFLAPISISLHPNPATELFAVRFVNPDQQIIDVSILSAKGDVIRSFQTQATQQSVDCSNLARGIYFVRVQGPDMAGIQRLVLQ